MLKDKVEKSCPSFNSYFSEISSVTFTTPLAVTAATGSNTIGFGLPPTNVIVSSAFSPVVTVVSANTHVSMAVDTVESTTFHVVESTSEIGFFTPNLIGLSFDAGEKGGVIAGCICGVGMIAYFLRLSCV